MADAAASPAASAAARPVIPYAFAREAGMAFLDAEGGVLAVRRGADLVRLFEVRRALERACPVRWFGAADFDRLLQDIYAYVGLDEAELEESAQAESLSDLIDQMPRSEDLLGDSSDAPVIRLINGLIAEAVRTHASDVHVETFPERVVIRYRIDGVMSEAASLSPKLSKLLVSRIKVMARLDIAEKRLPQDGRLSLALGDRAVDVRVSTLPSRHGERVVLRLLDNSDARLQVADLGMTEPVLAAYRRALAQPNGIVLVTGPTGAGKTTTLYAGLAALNSDTRNILTVEDPIEYAIDGIGQTQVNSKVGMTFANGLRAILRQDPDVVMVGEIRDRETAEVAVQASLTGHLVLSTIHTNSAVAAIARLRDMGVESYLLASTLTAILAQRLVRRLCPSCCEAYQPDAAERQLIGADDAEDVTLFRPVGCARCKSQGYEGRIGIYELVEVDAALRSLIYADARDDELAEHAFSRSDTLFGHGVTLAREGMTSLAEVMRLCRDESGGRHAGL
ncbi:ATPase, T2SS/T4P/T4SS family [Maricaulis sp.]|uniref:GspE/PulE family protein n=1 Tax=Maricaulis sp. TaxID=1486257 RepID=UPI002637E2FC|nr:ATPase, T2SS/T4P/T4SS family [Maricaulis sp.]MDF1767908.1 ATPase, T2SS/T4P/T4SS family [Maricaulis sp.]